MHIPALIALAGALQPQLTTRRAALSGAAGTLAVAAASRPDAANASPLIASLALKRNREEQKRRYNALESASEVPYYDIKCERDDEACQLRKRRLASEAISGVEPGGFIGVAALLAIRGYTSVRRSRRRDE